MVLNPDQCFLILFGVKVELQTDLVSNIVAIKNSKEKKILGITFDSKLEFSQHFTSITKKTNIKRNALTRVQKHITHI